MKKLKKLLFVIFILLIIFFIGIKYYPKNLQKRYSINFSDFKSPYLLITKEDRSSYEKRKAGGNSYYIGDEKVINDVFDVVFLPKVVPLKNEDKLNHFSKNVYFIYIWDGYGNGDKYFNCFIVDNYIRVDYDKQHYYEFPSDINFDKLDQIYKAAENGSIVTIK